MTGADCNIELATTADLSATDLQAVRRLMDAAFGDRFSEEDWKHATGGTHFYIRGSKGSVVSHASVVGRRLESSGAEMSTGYVEAVATEPEFQRRGLATAVMLSVAEFVQERFELGALSSGNPAFYERLGWIRWRGATWCREEGHLARTADEDGGVLVLPTRYSPPLDFEGDIAVEWRSGDVW
jgi:aminoglycoside 2'-N-acetyltransferase I